MCRRASRDAETASALGNSSSAYRVPEWLACLNWPIFTVPMGNVAMTSNSPPRAFTIRRSGKICMFLLDLITWKSRAFWIQNQNNPGNHDHHGQGDRPLLDDCSPGRPGAGFVPFHIVIRCRERHTGLIVRPPDVDFSGPRIDDAEPVGELHIDCSCR